MKHLHWPNRPLLLVARIAVAVFVVAAVLEMVMPRGQHDAWETVAMSGICIYMACWVIDG